MGLESMPCRSGKHGPGHRASDVLCFTKAWPCPVWPLPIRQLWRLLEELSQSGAENKSGNWGTGIASLWLLPGGDRDRKQKWGSQALWGKCPSLSWPQQQEIQKAFLCFPQGLHEAQRYPHLEDSGLAVSFGVLESEVEES